METMRKRTLLWVGVTFMVAGCAGTQVTRVQALSESADVPYRKILVVALLDSFDARKYLESELVTQLSQRGVDAVASTSMMTSRDAATRRTVVAMVDDVEADAVLVSQLASVASDVKVKDMRPEATYNFRPTYYYNVWSVELTEYVEPQSVAVGHSIVLASQLYSVSVRDAVWGIEAKFRIAQNIDQYWDYAVFPEQAEAVATHMSRDGLIAR